MNRYCSCLTIIIFFLVLNLESFTFSYTNAQVHSNTQNESGTMALDKLPSTPFPLFDILIILLTGGAVTTWLTFFFNNRAKEREISVDISKHKLETLSKVIPLYIQFSVYSVTLGQELSKFGNNQYDKEKCLYFFCQILYKNYQIFEIIGGYLLGSNIAEKVVVKLCFVS